MLFLRTISYIKSRLITSLVTFLQFFNQNLGATNANFTQNTIYLIKNLS